ncbi:MAG TPA: chorismate-binding protein, partial [Pseudomonadota bacterium]|nr:chorismate-binding protein [Pseudomonadota bacterium]
GLYAGPVGYFDEHGDGELVVAIRSALLQEQVAYLYAGAGIVSGSQAAAEYTETAQKQQVMLAALGVAQ